MKHSTENNKATMASVLQYFQDATSNPIDLNYAINIQETDHKYKVEIAVPGFKKGDFNVVTEGGLLTITAKADEEENADEKNYIRTEFSRPSLSRDFTLPEDILSNHVSSKYHNGILTVNLKKNNKYLIGEKHIKIG